MVVTVGQADGLGGHADGIAGQGGDTVRQEHGVRGLGGNLGKWG